MSKNEVFFVGVGARAVPGTDGQLVVRAGDREWHRRLFLAPLPASPPGTTVAVKDLLEAWDLQPVRPLPPVRVGPSSLGCWAALVLWALVGLALVLACAGCSTPSSYRTADRSRFEVIAPEYDRYVDADPKLDAEQRERRHRLTRAWDADSAGLDERPTTNGGGK